MQTWPDGQPIEAGGACIGPHPSTVLDCFTLRGEIFQIYTLVFHSISSFRSTESMVTMESMFSYL